MYNGTWEWDDAKNELNIKKHRLDFWTAANVFEDPNRLIVKDRVDPETGELRWHAIGSVNGVIVTLVHTYKRNEQNEKNFIRFISAFESDKREILKYFTQDQE